MDPMRLEEITAATGGTLVGGSPTTCVRSVSTDTRTLRPGELFIALEGERFDAHAFLNEAFARGAAAAVVKKDHRQERKPLILVENTTQALQDVARASRARYDCTVVAVTGSNGKTTTKDFIASLAARRFRVVKSEGSFNNHVGVPLTLLQIDRTTDLAVVEIGMSAAGEIRALAAIARPQVGVITNVNPAHLEFFESIAAIAEAKGELLDALPDDGTAVLNADDAWVRRIGERWTGRRITFGTSPEADVCLSPGTAGDSHIALRCFGGPELHAVMPAPGRHNALNAAAAVAACCAIGMTPDEAVENFGDLRLPKMRFERHEWRGAILINDAYNANPESMRAALTTFAAMPVEGRRIVVCGEMRELGASSAETHREIGRLVAEQGFDRLISIGGQARIIVESAVEHGLPSDCAEDCGDVEKSTALLKKEIGPGDAVLIKGSRANRMERIVEELIAAGRHGAARAPSRT